MKKTLTLIFAFLLCTTWSYAQCTLGTTAGSECTFDTDGTLTIPTVDDGGNTIETVDIIVKAWGAGGGSNTGGAQVRARAGGGGGAYYTNTYTVEAGSTFTIVVGQPVAGNVAGGSSIFDFGEGAVTVGGGFFGSNSPGTGGTVLDGGTGTATTGGTGGARNGNTGGGGGGGGSGPAGMNNNGGDGTATMGGTGGTVGGTDGGAPDNPGVAVTLPGGGAGGTGSGINLGQNPGGVGRVTVCFSSLVLPVELVSFNANAKDNGISLEWQTASEVNNEGFEIQKSKDGNAWDMVDFVEGNGNSSGLNTYTSIDRFPTQGANYYRLKQLDLDGRFEYSKTIVVDFNNRLNEVEMFPNPAKDQLTLINGEGKATIYNAFGKAVKQLTIDANQSTIQLDDLQNGQYYLKVLQGNGTIVTKHFSKIN